MTLTCHTCHRENPAGRGVCQFCGSRLTRAQGTPDPDADEAGRLREMQRDHEIRVAALTQQLDGARQDLEITKEELREARQKAVSDTMHDSDARMAEEQRLRDSLATSENNRARLQSELDATTAKLVSIEKQLRDHMFETEQSSTSLKGALDAAEEKAATELRDKVAGGEKTVATLKQQHADVTEKLAKDHQQAIAQKESLIKELRDKLRAIEDKLRPAAVQAVPLNGAGTQETTTRRNFGMMAMTLLATVSSGAGGIAGYFIRPAGSSSPADEAMNADLQTKLAQATKLNRDLEEGLRSQHEAYERVTSDLKRAESELKNQPVPNPGPGANDDLQRQLTELRAAGQDQQRRLAALEAELEQRKQDITSRDQTIAQLNEELQVARAREVKAQDTKPHVSNEVRPKPRPAIDLDTTIRNLEREYGIPGIGR